MTAAAHRDAARRTGADGSSAAIAIGLVTVSDSRTAATDVNGRWLAEAVRSAGHVVGAAVLVRDDPAAIDQALDGCLAAGCRVVVVNGGTGISRRDTTADVVLRRFDKVMPGFGELFRMLSWESVGAAATLSRAAAGTVGDAVVYALPGSPDAVRLAFERLISPEIEHVVWEMGR